MRSRKKLPTLQPRLEATEVDANFDIQIRESMTRTGQKNSSKNSSTSLNDQISLDMVLENVREDPQLSRQAKSFAKSSVRDLQL